MSPLTFNSKQTGFSFSVNPPARFLGTRTISHLIAGPQYEEEVGLLKTGPGEDHYYIIVRRNQANTKTKENHRVSGRL